MDRDQLHTYSTQIQAFPDKGTSISPNTRISAPISS